MPCFSALKIWVALQFQISICRLLVTLPSGLDARGCWTLPCCFLLSHADFRIVQSERPTTIHGNGELLLLSQCILAPKPNKVRSAGSTFSRACMADIPRSMKQVGCIVLSICNLLIGFESAIHGASPMHDRCTQILSGMALRVPIPRWRGQSSSLAHA